MYIIIFVLAIIIILILWKIPIWQLRGKKNELGEEKYLTIENELRKTLAQIIGGLFVLGGLAFTWDQISATRETIIISQERLITDRYSKAIDQLGNNDNSQTRLGGIFALGKIAQSSEDYNYVVNKVLSTYIRLNYSKADSIINEELQAAIEIIFLKDRKINLKVDTNQIIDISGVALNNFNFNNTCISRVKMLTSHFENSTFQNAKIDNVFGEETNFSKSDLTKAVFLHSNFKGGCFKQAIMKNCTLTDCNFNLVNLDEADLTNCDFTGTNLSEVTLKGSILYGANLENAKGLNKNQLNRAHINSFTKLPKFK